MFNQKEYFKKYYQEHKEIIKARSHQRRLNIPEYNKQWQLNHSGYSKLCMKEWHLNHIEYEKQYRKECRQKRNKYNRILYKLDPKYNLNNKIKTAIKLSLKHNKTGRHWEDIVGYTLDDLLKRLRKTIPEGYIWQDYMKGKLHIDHIIPISAFNFTKPEHIDFKRCWALKNLRFLPAKENLIKNAKLYKSFQPSLAI